MELVYLWVEDYKNIKKQGFNFSPRFRCEYDDEKTELTIEENKEYVSIFPDKINITAIVGENGSGKSSLIKSFIRDINQNTVSYDKTRKLACYLNYERNTLYIHTYINGLKIRSLFPYKIEMTQGSFYQYNEGFEKEKFESFYYIYQPNFDVETDIHDCFEYNESIIKYQEPNKQNSIIDLVQTNKKIAYHLLNYMLNKSVIASLSDKAFFEPTGVYLEADNQIYEYLPKEYDLNYQKFKEDNKNKGLLLLKLDMLVFFQYDYMNIKNVQPNSCTPRVEELKAHINITENISEENINRLFLSLSDNATEIIDSVSSVRNSIKSNHNYSNDSLSLVLNEVENYFLTVQKIEQFISICYEINEDEYEIDISKLTADAITMLQHMPKWFSIGFYEKNGRRLEDLSSGEQNILKIIYSIQNIVLLRKNLSKTINIFLDEVENTLHPNWQKKLLKILIGHFRSTDLRIYFYISSHSPFILSDLPKENIVFLEKGKQVDPDIETFGANIHTLLSHGFFMDDGLMGEYAKENIQSVIDFLNDKKNALDQQKAWSIIQLVGEPFLKHKLEEMYHEKFSSDDKKRVAKIKQLEEEIERLKNVKSED